jgi:hypothetical protein
MAKVITCVDDMDGKTQFTPGKDGREDVRFTWNGGSYLLDLSDQSFTKVDAMFQGLIEKARKAPVTQAEHMQAVRQWNIRVKDWATRNGHKDKIPAKGAMGEALQRIYEAANPEDLKPVREMEDDDE